MGLMGIGEFARLSRLSPKALRLYDELGLLPPARVDLDSGYRWYASGQLDQARLVASLRQIGVPLAQIMGLGNTIRVVTCVFRSSVRWRRSTRG